MDRYTAITIAACIVITVPFAISAVNIIGADQIQYRWDSPGMFSFFKMSTDGTLEFCNTMPFWLNFERFEATMYYQGQPIGTYAAGPITADPLASATYVGTFESEQVAMAHSIFMTIDHGITSGEAGVDMTGFAVHTDISTPILGIIPYHTTEQMQGGVFDQRMRAEDLECN